MRCLQDDRYRAFVGKKVKVPMSDREIIVIADDYVDREFGTGALKITPAHDPNDYEIGKRCVCVCVRVRYKLSYLETLHKVKSLALYVAYILNYGIPSLITH